jgi:hypothetical protein
MARFDWKKIQRWVIGAPRDPMHREQREGMLLVAFLAWIGLGADGLSSANYGPEEAFLALGIHSHLAIYLALATALTVVIICLGYVQMIRLFPSGAGAIASPRCWSAPMPARFQARPSSSISSDRGTMVASGVGAVQPIAAGWQTGTGWSSSSSSDHRQSARGQGLLFLLMPIFVGFLVTMAGSSSSA